MLKASQKRTKRAPLMDALMSRHSRQKSGLVRDDAHGASVEPREADDKILREVLVHFEESAIVRDGMDYVLHVVRLLRVFGDHGVQAGVLAVGRVGRGAPRRVFEIVRREIADQFPDHGEAFGIVPRDEMRDAAFGVVRHGAAEFVLRYFLVRDRADHIRAGDEHVRSVARHKDKIGDGRGVNRAARARSQDRADLRNHPAGERVAQKNIRITRERHHAFLNARAARIIETDHGRAHAHREIHDFRDF